MKKVLVLLALCISPLVLSGCWDRTELNDLAFKMGLATDLTADGMTKVSSQIAVPSQFGGSEGTSGSAQGENKGYIILSGVGRNTREAIQNMQEKVSRHITAGQRKGIFISEELAQKRGLTDVIDANTRDPDTRLRTDIFMVTGGSAADLLKVYYPFERVPVLAAVKIHKMLGGTGDTSFRDFLESLYDSSSAPTLPIIDIYQEGNNKMFKFGGRAIFDKSLKLRGTMDYRQSVDRLWITNQIQRFTLSDKMPHTSGTVSLDLSHMKAQVHSIVRGRMPQFIITLKGDGGIRENTTSVDLTKQGNLQKAKSVLNEAASQHALGTIKTMQKLDTDVFGLGRALHRQHPRYWKRIQGDWNNIYPQCKVTVQADLSLKRIGLTGSFLEKTGGTEKA